jgi:hypothetical protein
LTREVRKQRRGDGWRVPVKLPTMDELAISVVSGPSEDDERTTAFVRTVFPISFLNASERENVIRLKAFLDENDLMNVLVKKREEAGSLLEAVWRAG